MAEQIVKILASNAELQIRCQIGNYLYVCMYVCGMPSRQSSRCSEPSASRKLAMLISRVLFEKDDIACLIFMVRSPGEVKVRCALRDRLQTGRSCCGHSFTSNVFKFSGWNIGVDTYRMCLPDFFFF